MILNKKVHFFTLLALLFSGPLFSVGKEQGPVGANKLQLTRAVCATCPTPSAQFCSVCADTGIIQNLVVSNLLTICSGVTGIGCFCCYNDSLTWGPDEMHPRDGAAPAIPTTFQPYSSAPITYNGWEFCSPLDTGCPPNFVTAQFEVPADLDPSIIPSVTIHFFYPGGVGVGSWVRFHVDVELLADAEDVNAVVPLYSIDTANKEIFVPDPPTVIRHYQITVPLTGITSVLQAGIFGAITISRIPNTEEPEGEALSVYLSALSFNYRKTECPPVIV